MHYIPNALNIYQSVCQRICIYSMGRSFHTHATKQQMFAHITPITCMCKIGSHNPLHPMGPHTKTMQKNSQQFKQNKTKTMQKNSQQFKQNKTKTMQNNVCVHHTYLKTCLVH